MKKILRRGIGQGEKFFSKGGIGHGAEKKILTGNRTTTHTHINFFTVLPFLAQCVFSDVADKYTFNNTKGLTTTYVFL